MNVRTQMSHRALSLLFPSVRNVYEQCNELLARMAQLEAEKNLVFDSHMALKGRLNEIGRTVSTQADHHEAARLCLDGRLDAIGACLQSVERMLADHVMRFEAAHNARQGQDASIAARFTAVADRLDHTVHLLADTRAQMLERLSIIERRLATFPEAHGGRATPIGPERQLSREFSICRALESSCIFIIGFARSSTTITLEILNTAHNALILGEANFFRQRAHPCWSDGYNAQHLEFLNQATKSAFAPNFVADRDHVWWEWLEAASHYYAILGDKIALSSGHFFDPGPEVIRRFFEARFFKSKYVFLLRNPVDTLLSLAKLLRIDNDAALCRECDAWLRYIQLWADWIRNFPHTLTLVAEDLGEDSIALLASFTGLRLEGAATLLDAGNKRSHEIPPEFSTLAALKDELMEIHDLAKTALGQSPLLWQAEQKRSTEENASNGDAPGRIAVVPRPLGQAWAKAEDLRARIAAMAT